ncbi:MAG: hypothetical protein ABFD58_06725 [Anaerolineaceae bacterium]
MEILWTAAAFILTLMILSYFIGDNPLFRLAVHIFIGVAAGYVAVMVIYQVLLPHIIWPLIFGSWNEKILALVPTVLSILLVFKLSPKLRRLGNIPMAYITGASAAIIIGGAIYGTIVGQGTAAISTLQFQSGSGYLGRLLEGVFILLGTISTIAYFQFGTGSGKNFTISQPKFVQGISKIGQVFIMITLGAVFAGVLLTALSALIDRLVFIIQTFGGL